MKNKPSFFLLITFGFAFACKAAIAYADTTDIEAKVEAMEPKQLSAVLVMQDNKMVYEQYYNGSSANQLHDIRSASKTFTGLMFGVAIEDGLFDSADEKVLSVFEENQSLLYPSEQKSQMTFFDLLTMTNPLECDDMNSFSAGNEEKMYLTYDWVSFFLNLPARGNPPWEKPMVQQKYGRDFSYCAAGISITAGAIEKRSGMRFSDYTQEKLFDSLGISTVEWPYSEAGMTQGGGGVEITAKDLIKIGQLVLQKGLWHNVQLISQAWIEKSLKAYSVSMPEMNATYGITWWHFPFQLGEKTIVTHAAAGNGGNYLFVIPELNAAVVILATLNC